MKMGLGLDLRVSLKLQDTSHQRVRTHYGSAVTGDRWAQTDTLPSLDASTPKEGGICSSTPTRTLKGPTLFMWFEEKWNVNWLKCKHLNLEAEKAPSQAYTCKHFIQGQASTRPCSSHLSSPVHPQCSGSFKKAVFSGHAASFWSSWGTHLLRQLPASLSGDYYTSLSPHVCYANVQNTHLTFWLTW